MSFTYDITTNVGKLRLIISDNNSDSYIFEDDELDFFLDRNDNNITRTAIEICRALAMKFMQESSAKIRVDDIQIEEGNKHKYYTDLANDLERQLTSGLSSDSTLEIYFGGIYQDDINNNKQDQYDNLIVNDPFRRDMYDTF